jgi:hypothetical protein
MQVRAITVVEWMAFGGPFDRRKTDAVAVEKSVHIWASAQLRAERLAFSSGSNHEKLGAGKGK